MSAVTVGIFIGTRADLSPLVPVLRLLDPRTASVATAVGFDADTLRAEFADRAIALPVDQVGPVVHRAEPAELVRAGAGIAAGIPAWLASRAVDVLVVLGDRWELLYAVPPAVLLGVRVVHLHGGEITEGALDDRIRHAMTKLADQHAVATAAAAEVVGQLGEPADRIHRTGAPGLDLLVAAPAPDDSAWHETVPGVASRPLALVTVHPPTASDEAPADLVAAVLDAVADTCAAAIVTDPGPDPGRDEIMRVLEAEHRPQFVRVPSLGRHYPAVLRSVDVVVGNSSSGVIEAAAAGVRAVDVGDRQHGRERADSVEHAAPVRADIAAAIRRALAAGPVADPGPYGDGHAAARIVDVIASAPAVPRRKPFLRTNGAAR